MKVEEETDFLEHLSHGSQTQDQKGKMVIKPQLFICPDGKNYIFSSLQHCHEKRPLSLKKKQKHKPFRLLTSAVKTPHSWGETHYHQIIYTLEEEIYFRARANVGFDEEKHGVSSRWNITNKDMKPQR